MLGVEHPVTVRFPSMRGYVMDALESLADLGLQARTWGVATFDPPHYDDLWVNIALLYDDTQVLPEPAGALGDVLLPADVDTLALLGSLLTPLLDAHRHQGSAAILADARWPAVVAAASAALTAMKGNALA